jgi:hypothetical protein
MRKQYSATYKAEIVKELLKEEKTLNQLAAATIVHHPVSLWPRPRVIPAVWAVCGSGRGAKRSFMTTNSTCSYHLTTHSRKEEWTLFFTRSVS